MNTNLNDISMEELPGTGETPTPEQARRKAEYHKLASTKVMFRGVERNRGDFCSWTDEPLGDDAQLSWDGFTEEESRRAAELAQPFNDKYYDEKDENSMSMFAKWMDKDGFIFKTTDDLTGSGIDYVPEKDLATFLAGKGITTE
jgi:hypothetical protein